MASILSSTVPRQTNLWTSTLRFWPMRKARSVAWFSTAGIPPAIEVDDVRGRGQVQPAAARLQREHEERRGLVVLEARAPGRWRCFTAVPPCSTSPAGRRRRARKSASGCGHRLELREHQHLLLPVGDRLAELAQARELAAVASARSRRRPATATGWLQICLSRISDRQHHALALRCRRVRSSALGQVLHRLLVERRLLLRQAALGLHLGLVRQVGDDRLVGLHPPQDVGPHQLAQRAVAPASRSASRLTKLAELLGADPAGPD